jgi:hypothetical protein
MSTVERDRRRAFRADGRLRAPGGAAACYDCFHA